MCILLILETVNDCCVVQNSVDGAKILISTDFINGRVNMISI